jgi:uncharacterized protein YbaP (TraB family)
MKTINITAKEQDAIDCMIEFFLNNDDGFMTRDHKRFHQSELAELQQKINIR